MVPTQSQTLLGTWKKPNPQITFLKHTIVRKFYKKKKMLKNRVNRMIAVGIV